MTPDYVRVILVDGLLNTLKMAAAAILGASVLGFVLGVGKLSDHAWVRWPAWAVVEFFRAIPVLLLMVFIWYFIGIEKAGSSFWAVVIALTLYNGSVLAEVLRAGVLAVPKGQREAAYAIGMRKTQVMNIVLMPQAIKIMLPAIISQCIVALKDTALGIYVVAPGLTEDLQADLPGVRQPGADHVRHRRRSTSWSTCCSPRWPPGRRSGSSVRRSRWRSRW